MCLQVILATCLRDKVPAVHRALLKLIFALRRLDGQVVSQSEAERMRIEPGMHVLDRRSLTEIHMDIIIGLVMLEGSLPACHLNPLLHRFVHYATKTAMVGCLRWFSMYAFERYNKKIKNLVRNPCAPLPCIATGIQLNISARFLSHAHNIGEDNSQDVHFSCRLSGKPKVYRHVL